jgi:hypothetical protein
MQNQATCDVGGETIKDKGGNNRHRIIEIRPYFREGENITNWDSINQPIYILNQGCAGNAYPQQKEKK